MNTEPNTSNLRIAEDFTSASEKRIQSIFEFIYSINQRIDNILGAPPAQEVKENVNYDGSFSSVLQARIDALNKIDMELSAIFSRLDRFI